jgi:hypothetical protein
VVAPKPHLRSRTPRRDRTTRHRTTLRPTRQAPTTIDDIAPPGKNPRSKFTDFEDLAARMCEVGVPTPGVIKPDDDHYTLHAATRHHTAATPASRT